MARFRLLRAGPAKSVVCIGPLIPVAQIHADPVLGGAGNERRCPREARWQHQECVWAVDQLTEANSWARLGLAQPNL